MHCVRACVRGCVWWGATQVFVLVCVDAPVVVNAGEFRRLQLQEEKQKALLEKQQGSWKVIQGIADDMPSSSSPPRRRRRARHDSDNESEDQDIDGDESPPRRRARHDSDNEGEDQDIDGDESPPRRRARHDSDNESEDQAIDGDESPPRRRARHDSDNEGEDQDGDGDESPPRRRVHADDDTTTVPYDAKSEAIRMSDGSLAGMISGKELMKEMEEKRRREREQFAALGDHVTGRHAETVYRTEDGRAVSKQEYLEDMEQKRSQEKKYLEGSEIPWGKGLKQTAQDAGMTSSIDEEGPSRWDDPMAHILNRKPAKGDEPIITGSLLDKYAKQLKKAGFHVPLEIPKHSWLRRNLGAPPNRYGIKPGRHWDGVDRSNGFERELFKRQAELKRREHMAHMMAQEDM